MFDKFIWLPSVLYGGYVDIGHIYTLAKMNLSIPPFKNTFILIFFPLLPTTEDAQKVDGANKGGGGEDAEVGGLCIA